MPAILLFNACSAEVTRYTYGSIDTSRNPGQSPIEGQPSISIRKGGYQWTLTPKADYSLRGLVLHRKTYHTGWNSILSPCDVAMAWGPLVTDGLYKEIHWSQSGRWYWWRFAGNFPYDSAFISRYSSNNHLIPATENLSRALRKLGRGKPAELQGKLVFVEGRRGEDSVRWHSSLTRDDRGDGSCEVLYLERLTVDLRVYE